MPEHEHLDDPFADPEHDHLDDPFADPEHEHLDDSLAAPEHQYVDDASADPEHDHLDDFFLGGPATPRLDDDISPEVIELEKVPRRLWEQTLAPWHPQLRFFATHRIADDGLRELAETLVIEMNDADRRRRHARDEAAHRGRRTAAPLPSPGRAHSANQPSVQVNFRLRRDDYARLKEAADAVGMKPTTLARALVLNGAAKILQERGAT
jgi:hypothetical protein